MRTVRSWINARGWVNAAGELYYASARADPADDLAPPRPSAEHAWVNGTGWALDLTVARLKAIAAINDKAEEVRLRYITPGAGQAGTYLIKEREAEAYRDSGYTGTVPPMVAAEVTATGLSAQDAADLILAQRDAWLAKAAQIEGARRTANVACEALTTQSAIDAHQAVSLATLEAL